MADLDLTGGSHLINLVYNEENKPPPVDPNELRDRLKREKLERREADKEKRRREKEQIEKEKAIRKHSQKEVTIEHVRYPADEDEPQHIIREQPADEERATPKKTGRHRFSLCVLFFLLFLFVAALVLVAYISYYQTLKMHGGHVVEEPQGIKHFGMKLTSMDEDFDDENSEGRLPRNVEPIWYNITLSVFLPGYVNLSKKEARTFQGSLLSKFRAVSESKQMVLHASHLRLPKKDGWQVMEDKNGTAVRSNVVVIATSYNETLEQLTLTFNEAIPAGQAFYLHVNYSGDITAAKNGLYVSSYATPDRKMRKIAVSDSEPVYARRMLPLMDEPDRKAVFKVHIEHPKGTTALSNGVESDPKAVDGTSLLRTSFTETPKMASYLLTVVVHEYVSRETNSTNGIPIRAWAPAHHIKYTEYALSVAVKMLDYYEKYFEIPFPLEKLDMVAVSDFTFGAMENWGIITFEQGQLLYDPKVSSPLRRRTIAELVAHELSHQWFGNLVTMKWWSDLWLNEAFATHAEAFATARSGVMPQMADLFYLTTQSDAFNADQFDDPRPVSNPVRTTLDMEEIFDDVTYDKGASIVRQLEEVIGEENFRKGIVNYLKKFSYGNAALKDLLEAIVEVLPKEQQRDVDIKNMMWRYARQGGHPILQVERPDTAHVEIKENRKEMSDDKVDKAWNIPLFYEIDQEPQDITWMESGISIPSKQDDLLVLNSDSKGYYKVNYDPRGWDRISKELRSNHTNLSDLSRMRVMQDAHDFSMRGIIPIEVSLDMLDYLPKEKDHIPLTKALSIVHELRNRFGDEPDSEKLKEFANKKMLPWYKSHFDWKNLNYTDDSTLHEAFLAQELLGWLVENDVEESSDHLVDLFQNNFVKPCLAEGEKAIASFCSSVPTLIRASAYCEGIKRGGVEEFDLVVSLYLKAIANQEKERLLSALSCSQDTYLLKRLYHTLMDAPEEGLFKGRAVDEVTLLDFGSNIARKTYNDFFFQNFDELHANYKLNLEVMNTLVGAVSAQTKTEIAVLEAFMKEHADATEFTSLRHTIEVAKDEIVDWRRKYGKHVLEYIEQKRNRV